MSAGWVPEFQVDSLSVLFWAVGARIVVRSSGLLVVGLRLRF